MNAISFFTRGVVTLLAAGFAFGAAAAEVVVPKWGRFEQKFTSSDNYTNPVQQCTLTVVFISPFNETNRVHGFWDGDKTWRVRFAPDMPGKWGWATICSDASNSGLHLQAGSFVCTAPTGKTPLEMHGPVRVAMNGLTFAHADGTPFFWMADTAWNGPLLSNEKDWEFYLKERARQKFNVIQWVSTQWRGAPNGDDLRQRAFTGKEVISVNPEFFRRLDAKVNAANKAGFVNAPVILWALDGQSGKENPGYYLPEDQAIVLARYIVSRWQANDVVWFLGGDGHYFGSEGDKWKRIGKAVFENIRHAPVAMHPKGRHWIANDFRNEKWIGIIGYQSGHGDSDDALAWLVRGPLVNEWDKEPLRPLINLEPPYEGHPGYESKKPLSADFVRRALYWSLLNGPSAGVSYGANGVWSWSNGAQPPAGHPGVGISPPWKELLRLPGAEQVTNIVNFFTSIDFSDLRPMPSAIVNNPGTQNPKKYVACARSEKKDLTLVYVPEDRTIEILLDALPPSPEVKWFNPRSGETTAAVAVVTDRSAQFPTPAEGDWVLWMQTQKK